LTAPGKGVPNIVHGVNQNEYNPMISTFSLPLLVQRMPSPNTKQLKIRSCKGHLETIHSYTNDQNLVDNMHKKYRRGRAAALNMVITETEQVLQSLKHYHH
jgi:glyceraldehyde 3-phosphate dehydrogenase